MPLKDPKSGKREPEERQKRGARKSPKIVRNWGYRWRLWKQKVQNSCNARVRVRARGPPTHIFHKRKHFIFHLPFLPSRSLRQKVRKKVRQKRNYLGRFSKNVGDFLKNIGDFSKNVGDFQRSLRRYLYPIQHIPRSASIFRLHRRALLLLQAMVPLHNWACFAFGQRLLRCITGTFIISPRAWRQKKSGCVKIWHTRCLSVFRKKQCRGCGRWADRPQLSSWTYPLS